MRWTYLLLIHLAILSGLASCNQSESQEGNHASHDHSGAILEGPTCKPAEQNEETKAMVSRLRTIAENPDIGEMWHQNQKLAQFLDVRISEAKTPNERIPLIFQAGVQWLNAGDYNKSIFLFNSVVDLLERYRVRMDPKPARSFYEMLALANLRKGEIENCVSNHQPLSCLIPLDPAAQHQIRTGSETARDLYLKLLVEDKNDLQTRWLFNIAHMTLGSYPQDVPTSLLIPEEKFASEYPLPAFTDKAMEAGVAVNEISGGCVMDDFNQDGLLDLLVTSYGLTDQVRLFLNAGNGKFTDKTLEAGLDGIVSGLNALQADYNNDGFLDVLILRGAWLGKSGKHPNSLLKNNGDGTFSDVTASAGLLTYHPTQTASWADFNLDGWVDLYIGNESTEGNPHPGELFVNQQDGTFIEAAEAYGLSARVFAKGCVWGDYNNDSYPDLFVSNLLGDNLLFENKGKAGNFHFEEVAARAGVQKPTFSFPCWFWDYNNDGLLDLYVNSFNINDFTVASGKVAADYLGLPVETEYSCLYQNTGKGTFKNVTEDARLKRVLYTMGSNFGDVDNDGYADFYAATGTPDFRSIFPNRMFRNESGNFFQDVTTAARVGHIQKGHGVAFGDIDNDGDQDLYVVLGGSYAGDNYMNALYENPGTPKNNWITLELKGTTSNKSAIGAKIQVTGTTPDGQTRQIFAIVSSGGSFGASSLRQEMGLGTINQLTEVRIEWPFPNSVSTLKNLQINRYYRVTEGDENATMIRQPSFDL